MNNLYNIYIENGTEHFTMFELNETEIERVIEAYDKGKEDIFINGRRYLLKGLKEIRVFDMSRLQGSLNDFMNSKESMPFHHFQGNRISGLKLPALYMIGNDLTKEFITNDYGWKKQSDGSTILNHVSDVPLYHIQNILNLLNGLNNKYGFKSSDFAPPEPSYLDTPHVAWRLFLKKFPKYYFYFREVGDDVYIKHFPNKNENKEKDIKVTVNNGKSFDSVQHHAISWLKIIAEVQQEQKRWNDFFSSSETNEYSHFEVIEDENDKPTELTRKEIEDLRVFLNAFDDLIQSSKTLPEETKTAYAEAKKEAEEKLDNNPTKSFYKWLKKIMDALSVKYLTDQKFRDEINGYFFIAIEKAKNLGQFAMNWIKQIGEGQNG